MGAKFNEKGEVRKTLTTYPRKHWTVPNSNGLSLCRMSWLHDGTHSVYWPSSEEERMLTYRTIWLSIQYLFGSTDHLLPESGSFLQLAAAGTVIHTSSRSKSKNRAKQQRHFLFRKTPLVRTSCVVTKLN